MTGRYIETGGVGVARAGGPYARAEARAHEPQDAEQRREHRVRGEVWIQTDDPMTNYIGSTADVSTGGMYVHCPSPLPVGARCRVSITIHGATAQCEAWVARSLCTGRSGMGLVFRQPDLFFSAAVNALVESCTRPAWDLRNACTVRLGEAA